MLSVELDACCSSAAVLVTATGERVTYSFTPACCTCPSMGPSSPPGHGPVDFLLPSAVEETRRPSFSSTVLRDMVCLWRSNVNARLCSRAALSPAMSLSAFSLPGRRVYYCIPVPFVKKAFIRI